MPVASKLKKLANFSIIYLNYCQYQQYGKSHMMSEPLPFVIMIQSDIEYSRIYPFSSTRSI